MRRVVKRVLVTGTGGTGVGAGVLQSLQEPSVRSRWWPVAVCAETFSWGLYAARERALVPWAAEPGYFDAIVKLAAGVDAIIPGTEAETVLLAERREELPVPVIANDAALMPLMADKLKAAVKLGELGLPVIPWYPWAQYPEACNDFGFPLVVKPTLNTSGSRGVHLVTNMKELDALDTFVRYTPGVIIQPYLGDADHEYTVGVMSGQDGSVIGSIVIRRHLSGFSLKDRHGEAAVSTGFSQGYITHHPELAEFCEDLAVALGSAGPLNLQIREHQGEFYVFEIHPRFSFSAPIRAAAGFNEPDMALRDVLLGEQVKRPAHMTGVAAIRAFRHVLVPVQEMCR